MGLQESEEAVIGRDLELSDEQRPRRKVGAIARRPWGSTSSTPVTALPLILHPCPLLPQGTVLGLQDSQAVSLQWTRAMCCCLPAHFPWDAGPGDSQPQPGVSPGLGHPGRFKAELRIPTSVSSQCQQHSVQKGNQSPKSVMQHPAPCARDTLPPIPGPSQSPSCAMF